MKTLLACAVAAVIAFRPFLLFVEFNPHIKSSYEAFAHILIGGFVGVWLYTGIKPLSVLGYLLFGLFMDGVDWTIRAASLMTLTEIACAMLSKLI